MTLNEALAKIQPADAQMRQKAQAKWNAVAKPLGSLGLLEDAIMGICAIDGTLTPDISKRAVVMFGIYYVLSMKIFGGITGDLAGWFLQWAELLMVFALVVHGKVG